MNKALIFIRLLICAMLTVVITESIGQTSQHTNVLNEQIAIDTLNKNRLKLLALSGGSVYVIGSVGLYTAWYKDYPSQSFHFFNDMNEWNNMDKLGHVFSGYAQSELVYKGLKWTGLNDNNAITYAALSGLLFQSTIELMDGFSAEWGFSVPDFTANILGVGSFALQQKTWGEQRIRLKFSTWPKSYENLVLIDARELRLKERAEDLYGSTILESALKDYNAQTIWLSTNIHSFAPASRWPKWLNIAVGYGAENLYGGFSNTWIQNGELIDINEGRLQRYGQIFISLDADLSRVHTSSKIVRTLLDIFNTIKLPFSSVEINTKGEVKFHIMHF